MKKRRILSFILITTFSVLLILCGTVMAYMFQQTEYEDNLFTPANVSCTVMEDFDGVKKESIQVINTGNIDAYLRVRLVSYWANTDGNIVAKPSEMPAINLASGWLTGTNNTYYYQYPVAPNTSIELLTSPISLEIDSEGYRQVLEVFAEAIQSKPTEAVTSAWDVNLNLSGNIASLK